MKNKYPIEPIDFHKISKKHKHWLWHLTDTNVGEFLHIQSLSKKMDFHFLNEIVNRTKIPIYETNIYDVINTVLYTDDIILQKLKRKKNKEIGPVVLGYNHNRFVYSTLHNCYCPEGVLEIIAKLNIEFLLNYDNN